MAPTSAQLKRAVGDYLASHGKHADRERRRMRKLPDSATAVAEAVFPCGRKAPHQYRLPTEKMRRLQQQLVHALPRLEEARSFERLHAVVQEQTRTEWKNAELLAYDVAQRFGAYVGLRPQVVYIHAGTAKGARALGLPVRGTVPLVFFPPELQVLTPSQLEDFLCIFAGYLRDPKHGPKTGCCCGRRGGCDADVNCQERRTRP